MALKFNPLTGKLDEYGPILTGTGTVAAAGDGTNLLPGIAFADDLNTGIYRPGADQLAISTGGAGRLFVDSSGRVGVGTTAPGNTLEVIGDLSNGLTGKGTINITSNTTTNNGFDASPSIGFSAPYSTGGPRILYGAVAAGKANSNSGNSAGYLSFYTSPASSTGVLERVRIDNTGRVGIGTTSPTAVLDQVGDHIVRSPTVNTTFANVRADSDVPRFEVYNSGTNTFSFGYRGASAPSVQNLAEIKVTANSPLAFYTNATERARIRADGMFEVKGAGTAGSTPAFSVSGSAPSNSLVIDSSGRLGIGTTSPLYRLSVVGDAGTNIVSTVTSQVSSGAYIGYFDTTTTDRPLVGALGNNFVIRTGSVETARFDASGRLLVGTSTARSVGGSIVSPQIQVESPNSGIAGLSVITNRGDSIGPSIYLGKSRGPANGGITVVADGDVLGDIKFAGADGTDIETLGAIISCQVDGTPGANDMPGRLVFSTTADGASSPTERMRINAAGGFKWSDNATYTSATDAKAEFRQSTNVEGLSVRSTNASFTSSVLLIRADRNVSGGEYSFITAGVAGVDNRFIVANSGNVTNTNNSYGAISDVKLKENIVDANSQWDDLKALQVRNYNFKKGQTHTQIGLVAQEVELVSPGLVSESPDLDEEGNDLGTVTKSVNYSVLYMKAVKALQEAMERIETLEAKVNALEGN